MARKSDKLREARIPATEASRSFSRLLDQIESGRRFVIHRRGRDVCIVAPTEVRGRRASECLALLRARSPILLDDGFESDLLEILNEESVEERSSWGS